MKISITPILLILISTLLAYNILTIGHAQKMETYFDEDFLQYQTIWAAAGTPNAIFELKTEDLQKMTDGKVAKVK